MGFLALILHGHLPFVRHPEHEHFLEEEWLFEAITETYIPLLQMMQRLTADGVPFKLTMSLTPTLCAMLQDDLLRERYVQHVDLLIDLMARECDRTRDDAQLFGLAQFYCAFFTESRRFFVEEWKGDLLSAFGKMRETGSLEIMASAATHAVLPLHQRETQRAQVFTGRDVYQDVFDSDPVGFWLPECAYASGMDQILAEANLRWFVLDAHGLMFGNPRPRRAVYAPCYTPAGVAAFARDRESSHQVWSAEAGYPGDPNYREFYRDIGWDLSLEHLGPVARGMRKFSGVKYHRITGKSPEKELYDREAAEKAADDHAMHFVEQRRWQLRALAEEDIDPIIVAPFDAELFGHWWFEGPRFLELVIRKTASAESEFRLTTPTEFLRAHPTQQTIQPAASSWGENGHLEVWLNPKNAWIYPQAHAAARKMTALARKYTAKAKPKFQRVLKQLARELLLAQASDWTFLIKTGTAPEYATRRTADHLARFNALHDQLASDRVDLAFLGECESRDNLFRDVDWRYFA